MITLHRNPTRITPVIIKIWQMLNCLWTIQHFERQVEKNRHKIDDLLNGAYKYMPTYTQVLRDSYAGAIDTFTIRIEDERTQYNQLLSELLLLSTESKSDIPEQKIISSDDDIESYHHQRT